MAMTKNKKRKAAIRQLAQTKGFGIARAGLINDRERTATELLASEMCGCGHLRKDHRQGNEYIQERFNDRTCTVCSDCSRFELKADDFQNDFLIVARGTKPGTVYTDQNDALGPQSRVEYLRLIGGSVISFDDVVTQLERWNQSMKFPFQIAEVRFDDNDDTMVMKIRDDLDQSVINLLGPDAEQVCRVVSWINWIEDHLSNEVVAEYLKLRGEPHIPWVADHAQDALFKRLHSTFGTLEEQSIESGWEALRSGITGHEIMALVGRHLIDESSEWNQAAYDLLTTPFRKVFGKLHPEDPDPDGNSIKAWGTEWEEYVVWGTHSSEDAVTAVRKHLIDDVGDTPENTFEMTPPTEVFSTAKKYWGAPDLPENDEIWPKDKFSTEPVAGWIPWMIVSV